MQAGSGRSRRAVPRALGGRLLVALIAVMLTALPAAGQTKASALVGVVVDSAGTAISGAQVRVVRPAVDGADPTPLASDVVTDAAGRFEVKSLTPGPVMFSVEHPRYELSVTEAELADGVTVTLRVTLRVLREVLPDAEPDRSTVRGIVSDSSGAPVPGVEVTVVGSDVTVRTDSLGRFVVPTTSAPAIYLRARRLGYSAGFVRADLADGAITQVVMRPLGQQLGRVTVRGTRESRRMADMDQRKALYGGVQIRREEIERLNPVQISQLLHGRNAAIRIRPGIGSEGVPVGRLGCPMAVLLDGNYIRGVGIDLIMVPREVAAIEAYASEAGAPSELLALLPAGVARCGVLAVWSR